MADQWPINSLHMVLRWYTINIQLHGQLLWLYLIDLLVQIFQSQLKTIAKHYWGIIIPKQVLDLSSMGEDDVLCANDHVLHEDRDWEVHGDSWPAHDSDGGTCNW